MIGPNGKANGRTNWAKIQPNTGSGDPPQRLADVAIEMVQTAVEKTPNAGALVILVENDKALFAFGGYATLIDALDALLDDIVNLYDGYGVTINVERRDES